MRLSKDGQGALLAVNVDNFDIESPASLKEQMEQQCAQGKLYHLRLAEFGLQTSIPACHYSRNGYNDTLAFHPDSEGGLSSFSFDIQDTSFLASLEKSAKKRRLMTTKQYETFETKASVQGLTEGPRPIFMKFKYDSTGREMKSQEQEKQQAEENQSFFGKYWMYILIGFLLLNSLGGGGAPEGGAPAAAAK